MTTTETVTGRGRGTGSTGSPGADGSVTLAQDPAPHRHTATSKGPRSLARTACLSGGAKAAPRGSPSACLTGGGHHIEGMAAASTGSTSSLQKVLAGCFHLLLQPCQASLAELQPRAQAATKPGRATTSPTHTHSPDKSFMTVRSCQQAPQGPCSALCSAAAAPAQPD